MRCLFSDTSSRSNANYCIFCYILTEIGEFQLKFSFIACEETENSSATSSKTVYLLKFYNTFNRCMVE